MLSAVAQLQGAAQRVPRRQVLGGWMVVLLVLQAQSPWAAPQPQAQAAGQAEAAQLAPLPGQQRHVQ